MRNLTKSMLSFTWVLPLYGVQQMFNLLMPQDPSKPQHPAAEGFDALTQAAEAQLGGTLASAYRAGDRMQRGMVDLMLGWANLETLTPSGMLRATTEVVQRSADAMRQGAEAVSPASPVSR
jgi:hypothetical protein